MGKMYINVLHRMDTDASDVAVFKALRYQQEAAHKAGMRTTLLMGISSLYCEECVAYAKTQAAEYGDEIGLNLHNLTAAGTGEKFGLKEEQVYLMPFGRRQAILSFALDKFNDRFGYYPRAVTSYLLDARTLNWLHENYPSLKAAITSCFEEGVKMFYGNQNQWYLFSDGGPWGAYFPARKNSLTVARDDDEYCGIVGLPHLNRDMIMAITSRDDLFSSHPANVVRAKAYDQENMEMPYMFHFIDQWLEQLRYNDYVYYNVYVGPLWLTDHSMLDESGQFSCRLYSESMDYLGEKAEQGMAEGVTMSEFACWFEENVKKGAPEVNKWHDIICGSKREMYWYIDPCWRLTIDANIGGAICDMRPHVGRLEKNLGNDTPNLENMNYPFIISCEHRGGVHGGSIHTVKIRVDGVESGIALRRTAMTVGRTDKGEHFVSLNPIEMSINGVSVVLQSRYIFSGQGEVTIERELLKTSSPDAEIEVAEYHCGCWGDNTYPEDMRGIVLDALAWDGAESRIRYDYLGQTQTVSGVDTLTAMIPPLKVKLSLIANSDTANGVIGEGWLFKPFYFLEINKRLQEKEMLSTCMKIQPAEL